MSIYSEVIRSISDDSLDKKKIAVTSWICVLGHPIYWWVWDYYYPEYIDSFELRFFSAFLCVLILIQDYWPSNSKWLLPALWHMAVVVALPVVFTYTLLANQYSGLWMATHIGMTVLLLLLVTNVVLYFLLLSIGTFLGVGWYFIIYGTTNIPNFPVEYIPVLIFILGVGSVFLHLGTQATIQSERRTAEAKQKAANYQAIAGGIAHEMRNPLSQVKHCLNSIENTLPTGYQERATLQASELNSVYRLAAHGQMAVNRGIQIISMLLDQVHGKPIDSSAFIHLSAARVVEKALDEYGYGSDSERQRVHFDGREDFKLRGDETLLVFVVFNLLKNALYYLNAYPDAQVRLRLENGDKYNILYFRDTGPGIAEDKLSSVFEDFFSSGKQGGTGLGLAYCKRVLNAFGGDIQVSSVLGEYTEFALLFPPVSSAELETAEAKLLSEARPVLGETTILLVDDDAGLRALVRSHLSPLNVQIDEAEQGKQALQLARETEYDLVVMDLNMPVMNGYEAAEAIRDGRAGERSKEVLVVAHTSEPLFIARAKAEKSGMTHLISKPCGQDEFIRALMMAYGDHLNDPSRKRQWKGITVLLVDDADGFRDSLASILEYKTGVTFLQAANGRRGLALLAQQHVDAVLTDINMPAMDGFEMTKAIRADSRFVNMPVIGLSGDDTADTKKAAKASGMTALYLKTVEGDELIRALALALDMNMSNASSVLVEDKGFLSGSKGGDSIQTVQGCVLDLDAAAATLGCPVELLSKRLGMFHEEYIDWPSRLRAALLADDGAELFNLSHKLKGSARMFHALDVESACIKLEEVIKNQEVGVDWQESVGDLIAALHRLLEKIGGKSF